MHEAADIRVHLQTPGWAVAAPLAVPAEPARLEVWLPFLQALASQVSSTAHETAAAAGRPVSCTKGCGSCCRQLVGISLVEARALAQRVAKMPQPRQAAIRRRFADAASTLKQSGILQRGYGDPDPELPLAETPEQRLAAAWFSLQLACPFLEDESCGIYEDRPLVCREHQVTSPAAACSRLFREPVDRIELPMRLGPALARAATKIAGVSTAMIPLLFSLELGEDVEAALAQPHDPRAMLEVLLGEIGAWRIEPATGGETVAISG